MDWEQFMIVIIVITRSYLCQITCTCVVVCRICFLVHFLQQLGLRIDSFKSSSASEFIAIIIIISRTSYIMGSRHFGILVLTFNGFGKPTLEKWQSQQNRNHVFQDYKVSSCESHLWRCFYSTIGKYVKLDTLKMPVTPKHTFKYF